MNKPNNPKCNTCFVVNNILRCWNCKYKTQKWQRKNKRPIMILGKNDFDLYKPKIESEVENDKNRI